jgi:hypothetical protein
MKLSTITITLIFCLVSTTFAYDYVIEDGDNFGDLSLYDYKTLLMTGGEGHHLYLFDWSEAAIQDTEPLIDENHGGIWILGVAGHCYLDFSGGEIHELDIGSYATATLSGGLIGRISSYQVVAPDPHIEIICRDWTWYESANILTGTWADYTTFNIRLFNQTPYDPVIENIKFTIVPEPLSLLLLAAGGTLLARRRR